MLPRRQELNETDQRGDHHYVQQHRLTEAVPGQSRGDKNIWPEAGRRRSKPQRGHFRWAQKVFEVDKENPICRFEFEQKLRRWCVSSLQGGSDFEYGFRQVLEHNEIGITKSEALSGK